MENLIKILKVLFIIICSNIVYATGNKQIKVTTSFSILSDFVKNIAKDKVLITQIVNNNEDMHEFEFKPSIIKKITNSDLIIINGLNFENLQLTTMVTSSKKPVMISTNGILPLRYIGKIDPHAWMNVQNVINYYIPNILNALINIDKSNQEYYIKNATIYIKQLQKLDLDIKNTIKLIPNSNRFALITHDSLNYYTNAYYLNFYSINGMYNDSDPSIHKVIQIEKLIKDKKIKAIFLENMINNSIILRIAKDTNTKVAGVLYSDSLATGIGKNSTYIDTMYYNLNLITLNLK